MFVFWYLLVVEYLEGTQQNIGNLYSTFLKRNTRPRNQQNTVNCIQYMFKSSA